MSDTDLRAWEESMKDMPIGYVGMTTGGFVNNCNTQFDLDGLLKTVQEFKAKGDAINADMIAALGRHIADDGRGLAFWSELLRVDFVTLVETLDGTRQPDGYFWDQVRRVFEVKK